MNTNKEEVDSKKNEQPPLRPGDSYVQSFARGLDVIKAFNSDAPQQSLSQVAAATGISRAGARRILHTLVHLGYVGTDGRLFFLTPKILDLGYAYLTSMPFWDAAQPIVENLVQQVKESSSISMLEGSDIVYVLRVSTRRVMSLNLSIGSRLPVALTSMGRVLLSGLNDDQLDEQIRIHFEKPPSGLDGLSSPDKMRKEIEIVRQQGWAMVDRELEPGLISIAAPIRDRKKQIIAAINVSGVAGNEFAKEHMLQMLPKLLKAADEISGLVSKRT